MEEAGLKKQILSTVAYYNELDYPLTAFEVWKYRLKISNFQFPISNKDKVTILEIINLLESDGIKKWVENERGFYFLKGRGELVSSRLGRNKTSVVKLKKLNRIVSWLRLVPFVRMIAVTGRLAMKNAESRSDLDLLIVLQSGRIWIGRTLVTLFLHMAGKRRHADKIKNRACLNHFLIEDSLNLDTENKSLSVALFSASEYYFSRALFGQNIFSQFQSSNGWIGKFYPNFQPTQSSGAWAFENSGALHWFKDAGEKMFNFNWLENKLGAWEKEWIEKNPKTHQAESFVEANDEHLIFLPVPQGEKILERFMVNLEYLIDKNKTTY